MTQGKSLVEDMAIEAASEAVHAFLDERFPDGAMPGGRQLFADDHLDAEFKHEAGCTELATVAVIAALSVLKDRLPADDRELVRVLEVRACKTSTIVDRRYFLKAADRIIAYSASRDECASCGKPLSRDCPQCRKDWAS